jgi:hypothetical protein
MSLRHPVVLTSLEEDFKRIGLIKDLDEGLPTGQGGEVGSGQQGHAPNSGADGSGYAAKGSSSSKSETSKGTKGLPGIPYKVGGDRLNPQSGAHKGANIDYAEQEEPSEDEIQEAIAEAEAWTESFLSEFDTDNLVFLSQEDMEQLESFADGEVEELPPGIVEGPDAEAIAALFAEADDEDDDEDDEEDDDEEDEPEVEAKSEAVNFLDSLESRISGLQEAEHEESRESAIPMFANIALISEMLADTFAEAAKQLDDEEYTEMAEGYAEIARYSAEVVGFLEEEEDIDFGAVNSTAKQFTEALMEGFAAYKTITEASAAEDSYIKKREREKAEKRAAMMKKMGRAAGK